MNGLGSLTGAEAVVDRYCLVAVYRDGACARPAEGAVAEAMSVGSHPCEEILEAWRVAQAREVFISREVFGVGVAGVDGLNEEVEGRFR